MWWCAPKKFEFHKRDELANSKSEMVPFPGSSCADASCLGRIFILINKSWVFPYSPFINFCLPRSLSGLMSQPPAAGLSSVEGLHLAQELLPPLLPHDVHDYILESVKVPMERMSWPLWPLEEEKLATIMDTFQCAEPSKRWLLLALC